MIKLDTSTNNSIQRIDQIADMLGEIKSDLSYMRGTMESHIQDKSIHQEPPCEAHKTLVSRLWVMGTGLIASLGLHILDMIKGGK